MNEKKRNSVGIVIIALVLVAILTGCSKEYTVVFNTDGGSNVASLKVEKDGKVTKPSNPTKENYTFDGWYYNGELYDFNTKVTKDIILEARWTLEGKVTGVSLNINELTLKPNGTYNLIVTVSPEDANNKNVKWTSSDSNIVSVSNDGKIKALKKGSATITVTTEDGGYSDKCIVTVTDNIVNVNEVTINGQSTVKVGKTIKLSAVVKPTDASDKSVTWKSSNTAIATVDKNGTVKGIKGGKVTITVTTNDGNKTATKEITVEEDKQTPSSSTTPSETTKPSGSTTPSEQTKPSESETPKDVKVTEIEIKASKNSVNVNENLTLTAVINPADAKNQEVTWESSDRTKATVSEKGVVTGVSSGKVTITVISKENSSIKNSIVIEVKDVYKVVYTRIRNNNNVITGYKVNVYRNNIAWTGFVAIEDGNGKFRKFADGTAPVEQVNENKHKTKIRVDTETLIEDVDVSYID